ncbi:hypothetical protein MNEG_11470 [Monoraphidium neglectum]|uniref:Uncharacterized protein n=1 Tax=Monoraphidium neglectum TaxID=145388 RepID=A0A0D2MP56_9CHLO|nr:hypothetical protein MNEG_11470 [Monoraphidium neglectum]KIY96490.1 hypothetical protein MNEG_11470 [Monoraphidium neglectum]|eukprot:XP_013895510.1 hypothetical protein MNEG_11470 [Monoraphidium neglectum]
MGATAEACGNEPWDAAVLVPMRSVDWVLPAAVWEHVADHLTCEDLLEMRAVCSHWRRELGVLVNYAVVVPSQQRRRQGRSSQHGPRGPASPGTPGAADGGRPAEGGGGRGGGLTTRRALPGGNPRRARWQRASGSLTAPPASGAEAGDAAGGSTAAAALSNSGGCSPPASVVGGAFPFLEYAYVAVDSEEDLEAAPEVLAALVEASRAKELPPHRGRMRFSHLPALARRLPPAVLARVTTLWLDTFPDEGDQGQWAALAALPALRALAFLVDGSAY